MKVIEITVSCDTEDCNAIITVEGYSPGQVQQLLAAQGWPQTRGLTDHCPQHRRKAPASGPVGSVHIDPPQPEVRVIPVPIDPRRPYRA